MEWEALGLMRWKLRLTWTAVDETVKLNVGHPDYADYSDEDLNYLLYEALGNFETVYTDYTLLEQKVKDWDLRETRDSEPTLSFRDDLSDVDRLIAIEFVWPQYKELKRLCKFLAIQMREAESELKSREAEDYYSVKVDRGMLRSAYSDQIGYDNDFLFEEVEFLPPDAVD